jgi:hypothetical protein
MINQERKKSNICFRERKTQMTFVRLKLNDSFGCKLVISVTSFNVYWKTSINTFSFRSSSAFLIDVCIDKCQPVFIQGVTFVVMCMDYLLLEFFFLLFNDTVFNTRNTK